MIPLPLPEPSYAPQHAQQAQSPAHLPPSPCPPPPTQTASTPPTTPFAPASFPQINIVGTPPPNFGFTICPAPTELNAFTNRHSVNSFCNRSINDSSKFVKNRSTPFTGGTSLIGLHTSITTFPFKFPPPAPAGRPSRRPASRDPHLPECRLPQHIPLPRILLHPSRQLPSCRSRSSPHAHAAKPPRQRPPHIPRAQNSNLHDDSLSMTPRATTARKPHPQ